MKEKKNIVNDSSVVTLFIFFVVFSVMFMFRGMLQGRTDSSPSVFCILWSWQFVHIHIKLNHIKYTFLIIMYLTLYLCFVGGWEVELICSHHAVFWTYSHSHMILYSKIYHNSHHWNIHLYLAEGWKVDSSISILLLWVWWFFKIDFY